MKNQIILYRTKCIVALCMLTLSFNFSCKKELANDYPNPDGYTQPTIEGFFSNVQQVLGIFRTNYGEYYHNAVAFNGMLGIGGVVNSENPSSFSWGYAPYGDTYARLRPIRAMNDLFVKLPAEQKSEYQIFIWTGNVMKDYLFYQLTDTYNDVPYTDAMKAQELNFFPKFDKQRDIYLSILGDLKSVADQLKTFNLGSSAIQQQFKINDLWFAGDINKWRIFTNSLRLRLAMRISVVEPQLAKTTIQEVLQDGVYAKDAATSITYVDKMPDRAFEYLFNRGFQEQRALMYVPENMMKVMRKTAQPEDPRIPVLFQLDKDGNYSVMPAEAADIGPINSQITQTDLTKTFPSIYNRTTLEQNSTFPAMIITSSEMHWILAEAAVRWPDLGIVGQDEYTNGIRESIDFYYNVNANAFNKNYSGFIPESVVAKPAATIINAFIAVKLTEYLAANNNEKIGLTFDQKYVHFNVLRPYEVWNDVRRLTKELGTRVKKSASNFKLMERTVYPTAEENNNSVNFATVKAQNNYTSPVWWTGR